MRADWLGVGTAQFSDQSAVRMERHWVKSLFRFECILSLFTSGPVSQTRLIKLNFLSMAELIT